MNTQGTFVRLFSTFFRVISRPRQPLQRLGLWQHDLSRRAWQRSHPQAQWKQ